MSPQARNILINLLAFLLGVLVGAALIYAGVV